ncbi:4Fe-4S dicluster domain-containing protein [Fluviicola taffensis]|uniref:4Fe-4S double cluster binding domain-containing protein n=1 Tax=Fluviicola taffensis TaxID=191579 RepID=UPI003137FE7D
MKDANSSCDDVGGKLMPIINLNNCGGKEDCIPACPFGVLEMRRITDEDRKTLNIKGKLKTFFNEKKAYVTDTGLCHACGICVQVCPEKAIKLTKNRKQ